MRGLARRATLAAMVTAGLCALSCHARPRRGEACGGVDMGHADCMDDHEMLSCRDFQWQLDACRGPDGCARDGERQARCDQRIAIPGDACGQAGATACSGDDTELLRCDGSRMAVALRCRGPQGCRRAGSDGTPWCDQGLAEVGDPCESPGSHCAAGGHAVLRCTGGRRYVLERNCPGPRGCFRVQGQGGRLLCDVSLGDVGEWCNAGGGSWCSSDGRQENTCKNGLLVERQPCPGGCTVQWGDDGSSYVVACRT